MVLLCIFISIIAKKYSDCSNHIDSIAIKNLVALTKSEGDDHKLSATEKKRTEADPDYYYEYNEELGLYYPVLRGYLLTQYIDCIGDGLLFCEPSVDIDYWFIEDIEQGN